MSNRASSPSREAGSKAQPCGNRLALWEGSGRWRDGSSTLQFNLSAAISPPQAFGPTYASGLRANL
jgi:hypothetical protein